MRGGRALIAAILVLLSGMGDAAGAMARCRRWAFALADLGVSEPIVLSGPVAEREISIPLPRGLQPIRLVGRVRISPDAEGAVLSLAHRGRTLRWIRLSPPEMRVAIPLEETRPDPDRLTLRWRLDAAGLPVDCATPERMRVELDQLAVDAAGEVQPPRTVAEFWPSFLSALYVRVADRPTPEEATAVLRLSAIGTRLASGRPLRVVLSVLGAPWPPSEDPWARGVQITRGPAARIAVLPSEANSLPVLQIAGPPETLASSVAALEAYGLAMRAPVVRSPESSSAPPAAAGRVTLAELGHPQIQMSGSGPMEAAIFFAQADLGGPVRGVGLRLAGRATPIPSGGQAQVQVLLNGGLVYAEPLNGGSFDRWIALPDGLLRRDNTLTVRVLYTPPGGDCRLGVHPITVFIDGASYLEFRRGTHLPPGFERLPQGLLPAFTVGLDPLNPETLGAAAQLMAALQRTTRTPLAPQVRPWAEAVAAPGPSLLITLDPARAAALRPPLDPRPFRVVDVDGRERFRMEMDQPFAVLEAFTAGDRELLLLTRHGDRPHLRGIGRALDPALGWYGLAGDVWIWPEGQLPVAMRLRGSGLRAVPLPPSPAIEWARIRFWVFGIALIGVIGFLIWAYPRVVRSAPPGASDASRSPEEAGNHERA
jgi:preprotein translocase subunit Sss1